MTCYPDLEPDIRSAGAEFVNREVVVDGSPGHGPGLARQRTVDEGIRPS